LQDLVFLADLNEKPKGAVQLIQPLEDIGLEARCRLDWQLGQARCGSMEALWLDECPVYVRPALPDLSDDPGQKS
jgi:hypothetical protein